MCGFYKIRIAIFRWTQLFTSVCWLDNKSVRFVCLPGIKSEKRLIHTTWNDENENGETNFRYANHSNAFYLVGYNSMYFVCLYFPFGWLSWENFVLIRFVVAIYCNEQLIGWKLIEILNWICIENMCFEFLFWFRIKRVLGYGYVFFVIWLELTKSEICEMIAPNHPTVRRHFHKFDESKICLPPFHTEIQ